MNIGVILAAGIGSRFNSKTYKQYLKLNGKEVVFYSISEMRKSNVFDEVILVLDEDEFNEGYIAQKYKIKCIVGGKTRNESVKNALDYVKENYPCKNIIFQDAVRPFVKSEIYRKYIKKLEESDAVISVSEITDSLAENVSDYVRREDYFLIQTPEAFRFDILHQSFNANSEFVAIVNHIPKAARIVKYSDRFFNMKITYVEDLFIAEQLTRFNYYKETETKIDARKMGKVLLLGGSGGLGQSLIEKFEKHDVDYIAPSHKDLDLSNITVERLKNYLSKNPPDVIINTAAAYANDGQGILNHYEKIFDINLRSNLVLMEYAAELKKEGFVSQAEGLDSQNQGLKEEDQRPSNYKKGMHLVLIGSSSSTKGRENLTVYSAAKAALNSVVESRAAVLASQNVYVNVIIPEKINTALIQKLHTESINERELLQTDEVIDAIIKYTTGTEYGQLVHIRKGL